MRTEPFAFFSNRLRLDADLHLPDDGTGPFPTVIALSGYEGLKVIHPERFARVLTARGYAVIAFDYRGFGVSEGERGRLVPQEWVEDVRSAVDRATTDARLDPAHVALLGWGLGGGVATVEAASDPRIAAVVVCNAVADGYRSTRRTHDEASWEALLEEIDADRGRRATLGRSTILDPWAVLQLDLDADTDGYVGQELYKAPGFGAGVTAESAEYLLRFSPNKVVDEIAPRPLLIMHGADNKLYYPTEAHDLYDHAQEPKRLEILEGAGHTEWMFDTNETFIHMIDLIDEFLHEAHFVPTGGR